MIAWDKLRHEWKTFALSIATVSIGLWDDIAPSGYDLSVFVPEDYRKYVVPVIGVLFIVLRRYNHQKDKDVVDTK